MYVRNEMVRSGIIRLKIEMMQALSYIVKHQKMMPREQWAFKVIAIKHCDDLSVNISITLG